MTEPNEKPGRLIAFTNKDHKPGTKIPAFKGTISIQGASADRHIVLWPRKSRKTGKTYFIGHAGLTAAEQIDKMAEGLPPPEHPTEDENDPNILKSGDVRLFVNEQKKPGSNQPDYYGTYCPGGDEKTQRLDVWAKVDKYGKPMLSGSVTVLKPRDQPKQEHEQKLKPNKPAKKKHRAMSM